jgi:hypothetical protein
VFTACWVNGILSLLHRYVLLLSIIEGICIASLKGSIVVYKNGDGKSWQGK